MVQDPHSECRPDGSDFLPDRPEPENAERFPGKFHHMPGINVKSGSLAPEPLFDDAVPLADAEKQLQNECERHLGNGIRAVSGDVADGDPPCIRCAEVDFVIAGRLHNDQSQLRQCMDDLSG